MTEGEMREELAMARRVYHHAKLQISKFGISAPPHMIIEAEDAEKRIGELERALGIARTIDPIPPRRAYTPPPIPRREFEHQVGTEQESARQADIRHQLNLLKIHRGNLAHYRAQAKFYGGVEQAPPMTRNGMTEARDGISRAKRALAILGTEVDDLPGDE